MNKKRVAIWALVLSMILCGISPMGTNAADLKSEQKAEKITETEAVTNVETEILLETENNAILESESESENNNLNDSAVNDKDIIEDNIEYDIEDNIEDDGIDRQAREIVGITYVVGEITNADGLSGLAIDGIYYDVDDNFDFSNATDIWVSKSDKRVVCQQINGLVTNVYSIEEIRSINIRITPDISEIIYKDKKLNTTEIQLKIKVESTFHSDFDYLPQSVLKQLSTKLTKFQLKSTSDGLNFGKEGIWWWETPINEISYEVDYELGVSSSKIFEEKILVDKSFVPEEISSYMSFECTVLRNKGDELNRKCNLSIGNLDLQFEKTEEKKQSSNYGKQVKNANIALNNSIDKHIVLDPYLSTYFDKDQLTKIKKFLYTWTANTFAASSSEFTKDQADIRKKVYKKLGLNPNVMTLISTNIISVDIKTNTKLGEKRFRFTVNLTNFNINDYEKTINIGALAYIDYAVYSPALGVEEHVGARGTIALYEAKAFIKNLQDVADTTIKDTYKSIWGYNADKVSDYLTEGTIVEVLKNNGILEGTFSDNVYDMLTNPTKSYIKSEIECPVDVKVFNADGQLCGAIKDNIIDPNYNDVYMYVDGDKKYIYLSDDNYYLELTGNDTGEMNYKVGEYDEDGNLLRKIQYNKLPLTNNITYHAPIPESALLNNSLYNLITDSGEEICATSDTKVEIEQEEPITWCLLDDGKLIVYGNGQFNLNREWEYKDDVKEICFLDGEIIIGKDAIEEFSNLSSIEMNNTVTKIGYGSFYNCDSLTEISISGSVSTIDEWAFAKCDQLSEVTFCGDLYQIGKNSFNGCKALETIDFKGNVEYILDNAFYNCSSLKEVKLPDGLKEIKKSAFGSCNNLKKIIVPSGVQGLQMLIGTESLGFINYYPTLESIEVSSENEWYTSEEGVLFNKDKTKLLYYPLGKMNSDYTIPDSVLIVGCEAFRAQKNIENITLSQNLKIIEKCGFNQCNSLKSITFNDNLEEIGESSFASCTSLEEITIPGSVLKIGDEAFSYSDTIKSIQFENPNIKIGENKSIVSNKAILYGYKGSTAKDYAAKYGNKFIALDEQATSNVTLSSNAIELKRNETAQLKVTIYPEDSPGSEVITWSSNNTSVSTVREGLVKAIGIGRAQITVKTQNGICAVCDVVVVDDPIDNKDSSNKVGTDVVKKKYSVYFNPNKGKVSVAAKTVTQGSAYGTLPVPSRKNYTFKGWFTAKSGGTKITTGIKVNLTANQTLYAQWSKVTVKKPAIKKLVNIKGKKAKVTIKKVSGASGYQVVYADNKKFKKSKKKVTTKTSLTLKKLTKGKIYYFKIRAYKKDSTGAKVYSKYSKVKKVSIKK